MSEFDLYEFFNPEPKEGDAPRPRRTLGQVAKENSIARRPESGAGKEGKEGRDGKPAR